MNTFPLAVGLEKQLTGGTGLLDVYGHSFFFDSFDRIIGIMTNGVQLQIGLDDDIKMLTEFALQGTEYARVLIDGECRTHSRVCTQVDTGLVCIEDAVDGIKI